MELPEDVTMVNYEVMISKRDFDDLLEGANMRRSNTCLDLSPKSDRPSLSQFNFSFKTSGRLSSFDSPRGR